jgi:hypothetical protein
LLTYDGSALKKCARFTEGVAEIRQPSKYRIILYLCAEWEAEKGGRMGCLMKEKIQGLAERKAFILLFLFVWELCSSSGNLTCSPPPPFSPTSREYSLPQPAGALLHPLGGKR